MSIIIFSKIKILTSVKKNHFIFVRKLNDKKDTHIIIPKKIAQEVPRIPGYITRQIFNWFNLNLGLIEKLFFSCNFF